MDTAVALVEAYLRINGYLTLTEYPVLEVAAGSSDARTVSDLDMLAFRFAGAGHGVPLHRRLALVGDLHDSTDPALGAPDGQADMIVGEVKRGRAHFNAATRRPEVLALALRRFGCCDADDAQPLARQLLTQGRAESAHGHMIRMVVFGGIPPEAPAGGWHVVPLHAVIAFLQRHLKEHWEVLRHVHFSSDALEVLALLERARLAVPSTEHAHG